MVGQCSYNVHKNFNTKSALVKYRFIHEATHLDKKKMLPRKIAFFFLQKLNLNVKNVHQKYIENIENVSKSSRQTDRTQYSLIRRGRSAMHDNAQFLQAFHEKKKK